LDEIFSDDAIKDGRNTAAIEVMQDTLVSARILDHKNSTTQSLSVVKDEIIDNLKAQQAAEMAEEEGRDKLASLQQEGEEDSISWDEAKQVSYMQSEGLDSEILQAVFKVELTSFPTYTGIVNPLGGYTLIRISQIIEPDTTEDNPEKDEMFSKQLQQMLTQEEMSAYLAGLRQRHDVTIFRQEGL
jgi:peptidyl-prolyl cis-trans isomerase D